ncbi:hypothetical protein DAEQUDRAFT_731758 [Daedalea quercina L-15889]|uniref:AB hydrolase-1 domain-containing protein n=1 Tax=Daedalea quercina L-15889 TaxID=1314783 RepID=A0A165M1S7_9APHY|nr:hypothetical protein DAEQUDRAFT_731758 [Daedalea quercina L-15889]
MRLVAINMRDYRGSIPYTEYDLEALRSGDRGRQLSTIRARGLEIAAFLTWFIRQQMTPPMSDDGRTGGGLALLGWSWGNAMTMVLMAQAPELPEDDRCLLNNRFRSLIILDSARHGIGIPPTVMDGLDSPGSDTDIPDKSEERWLSRTVHYAHSRMVLDAFPSVICDYGRPSSWGCRSSCCRPTP